MPSQALTPPAIFGSVNLIIDLKGHSRGAGEGEKMESIGTVRGRLARALAALALAALAALSFAPACALAEEVTDSAETAVYLAPAGEAAETKVTTLTTTTTKKGGSSSLATTGDGSAAVAAATAGAAVVAVVAGLAARRNGGDVA